MSIFNQFLRYQIKLDGDDPLLLEDFNVKFINNKARLQMVQSKGVNFGIKG